MTKTLTTRDALRHLIIENPGVSVDEIRDKLEALGLNVPRPYYIAAFKNSVRETIRFLRREGLLRPHELPASMRGPRKWVPHENENDALHTGEGELLGGRPKPVTKRRRPKRSKPTTKRFDEFYYK